MPIPLLAAVAGPAATLFNYNRANFLYDSGQKVTRTYTSLSYQMQQFQLYRQDIRDLVALTTEKMTNYHVVACLELGMSATLLGPARLPDDVPEWVLWHQLMALSSAFVFLVTSMWLATRAAVAAGSFNVRLQTQYIRLPLPDDEVLDSALTKAEDFEGHDLRSWLEVPFVRGLWRRLWGVRDDSGNDGREGLLQNSAPAASSGSATQEQQQQASSGQTQPRSGQSMDLASGGPNHLQLYQQLQRKWSCYDAYARITMSLGTFWLILSLAYYEIGWNLCHLDKGFPAVAAAMMLAGIVILLVYLDVFVTRAEMAMVSLLILAGPTLVAIGAAGAPKETGETPWFAAAADLMHTALSVWFWWIGRVAKGKDTLPIRWKGVSYLDIFGPIVKELRALLDKTGVGCNAHTDEDHFDGQITDLFDFVDKDNSGTITREEWDQAFNQIDCNRSGTISREEWRKHHGKVAIFDVVDGNGNGAISRQEWKQAFDAFDRDGDGSITCDEWYGGGDTSSQGVALHDINVRFDDVAEARIGNARARLQAAIENEDGSTKMRQAQLNTAMQVAKLVGMRAQDPQIQEAQRVLAKLELASELRYLHRIVHDWKNGEVARHVDSLQRGELNRMKEALDAAAVHLGCRVGAPTSADRGAVQLKAKKAAQPSCSTIGKKGTGEESLPTILRSLSEGSTTGSPYVPVWTRFARRAEDSADGRPSEFWAGTATPEGRWGFADKVPSDAQALEFSSAKARVQALVEKVDKVLEAEAAAGGSGAMRTAYAGKMQKQSTVTSGNGDTFIIDDEDDPVDAQGQKSSNTRAGHHPVLAYRIMSLVMVGIWLLGTCVHTVRFLQDVEVLGRILTDDEELDLPWGRGHGPRLLAGGASSLMPELFIDTLASGDVGARPSPTSLRNVASPLAAASVEWPERFFRPVSLRCPLQPRNATGDQSHAGPSYVVASNGFLVYALKAEAKRHDNNDSPKAAAQVLECPVEEHDALVSADCDEDGKCTAIVAVGGGLVRCGAVRKSAQGSGTRASTDEMRSMASVSKALVRGRPPLKVWAAVDAQLSTAFAAPRKGAIVELRRKGSTLRPVAELQPPPESPEELEWQGLEVTDSGFLIGVALPGPTVVAWSLATGSFIGAWPVASKGVDQWFGWCAASGGLYGATADSHVGLSQSGAEFRRFVLPAL